MKKKIHKIIEYLLYLFVFLLPVQTRYIWHWGQLNGGNWEYGSFSFYLSELFFLLAVFSALVYLVIPQKNKERLMVNKRVKEILGALTFLGILVVINIFIADEKQLALYGAVRLAEGLALLLLILYLRIDFEKIGLAYLFGLLPQSVLAIYQFFTQQVEASKWLGMAAQLPQTAGASVVEFAAGRWLRAYGTLPHPNILAGFLVIGLIISLILLVKSTVYNERYFLWFCLTLNFAALFFTFSKSAFFALVLSFCLILVFLLILKDYGSKIIFMNFLLAGGALLLCLGMIYFDVVKVRLSGAERLEQESVNRRISYLDQAREIIKYNWLTGVGLGNYTWYQAKNDERKLPVYDYQPVHNVYLLILAELGAGGFLLLFYLMILILKIIYEYKIEYNAELMTVFRQYEDHDNYKFYSGEVFWFLGFTACLLVIFILFFFDHYFWTLYPGIMLFWLVFGLWLKQVAFKRV